MALRRSPGIGKECSQRLETAGESVHHYGVEFRQRIPQLALIRQPA